MSRHTVIVLRILAVGSALTILACQIVNRQQMATAAAGDRGASGVEAGKKTWAASSKSARMLSPEEMNEPAPTPVLPPPANPPAQTAPSQTLAPAQPAASPAPVRPAPARVRGFGSKSAPAITPADLRQMRQQVQQGNQPRQ